MGVAFERHGLLHYLDPAGREYRVGDKVLFPTDAGPEVAECVWPAQEIDSEKLVGLPKCLGLASSADLARDEANRRRRAEAMLVAQRLVAAHELPMRVVAVDYVDSSPDFDHQVVVYFTAPQRVDFRALLPDLARSLQSRIDLRQVAARDTARLIGGIGSCGRELCCTTFIEDFEPISMRLAKIQSPSGNPMAITGACGRLLCCLKFEHPLYLDFARTAPPLGSRIELEDGRATVIGHRVPDGTVLLRLATGETRRCCKDDLTGNPTLPAAGSDLARPL